jgi:hypothetical protein
MALRLDVQEQNSAVRVQIAKHARAFRLQPMDFPWLLSELHARGLDPLDGILADLRETPEQDGTLLSGYWVSDDRRFFRFEGTLVRSSRTLFRLEAWDQISPTVSEHERGTGKTFAFLALEVLDEVNSRPNKSLERTREG